MVTIKEFVKEIQSAADRSGLCIEPEQRFPDSELLYQVCMVLLYASTMREEGRYSSFRVCFLDPESEFLEPYIYAHTVLFNEPILFDTREIHRLAPAISADNSYMILKVKNRQIYIMGLVVGYTTWERIISGEITNGIRMPKIPNLMVKGPGEIQACLGEPPLVSLQWGNVVHHRTDIFTSTYIAEVLRDGSSVSENHRIMFLSRILKNVLQLGHGGHIYIVPDKYQPGNYSRIKYNLSINFMFSKDKSGTVNKKMDKDVITYADLISRFTSVDGAVVLSKNFDLIGFGAETLLDSPDNAEPDMCFINHDGEVDDTKRYNDNGMRHRACYMFCNAIEGAVAIIVSHDGFIKVCTKIDGKVVVYDNVSLPTM